MAIHQDLHICPTIGSNSYRLKKKRLQDECGPVEIELYPYNQGALQNERPIRVEGDSLEFFTLRRSKVKLLGPRKRPRFLYSSYSKTRGL